MGAGCKKGAAMWQRLGTKDECRAMRSDSRFTKRLFLFLFPLLFLFLTKEPGWSLVNEWMGTVDRRGIGQRLLRGQMRAPQGLQISPCCCECRAQEDARAHEYMATQQGGWRAGLAVSRRHMQGRLDFGVQPQNVPATLGLLIPLPILRRRVS